MMLLETADAEIAEADSASNAPIAGRMGATTSGPSTSILTISPGSSSPMSWFVDAATPVQLVAIMAPELA